jgi:hypothetical protein
MSESLSLPGALQRVRVLRADKAMAVTRRETAIARHQKEIIALREEISELDITERVLLSLDAQPSAAAVADARQPEDGADEIDEAAEAETLGEMEGKPPGTPSMPEMITAVLADALAAGQLNMEPKAMTAEIRKRWWPAVPGERVSPIAWRMFKRGDLGKAGTAYFLIGKSLEPAPSQEAHK